MADKELKALAMQMASLLPDDQKTSRRIHYYLGEIIEGWLFADQAFLRSGDESNITKFPGSEAKSSR